MHYEDALTLSPKNKRKSAMFKMKAFTEKKISVPQMVGFVLTEAGFSKLKVFVENQINLTQY